MQSLDIISVNLWQTLISLANLVLLFLIVKRFLFKPVQTMLKNRQNEIDQQYEAAENANRSAEENKAQWEEKISSVKERTDEMLKKAQDNAKRQSDTILSKAKEQAEGIVRQAEVQAELEMKKAEESIKQEIVEVSTALANKLLEREIKEEDHRNLIDSFIEKIGD